MSKHGGTLDENMTKAKCEKGRLQETEPKNFVFNTRATVPQQSAMTSSSCRGRKGSVKREVRERL